MFFLLQRHDTIQLPPRFFGKNLQKCIIDAIRQKTEGRCNGRYGYILAVTNIEDVSSGSLDDDTGFAEFKVQYNCLVFRPFKNEIIPTVVTSVTPQGIFTMAGPLSIFISEKLMPDDLHLDTVSIQPMFVSDVDNVRIEVGTHVRCKIVGMGMRADEMVCIGSIREDFLG